METRYQKIKKIVERECSCSAHAMEHVMRIYNLCLFFAKYDSDTDLDVLETTALLHDIVRVKEFKGKTRIINHATLGAEMADKTLRKFRYSE